MIVDHSLELGLRLSEPTDFKGFKLRLSGTAEKRPSIEGVTFIDDDHVLIGIEAVPALPGAPSTEAWRKDYDAMIAYARQKGWIEKSVNAIRAHVERVL